MPQVDPSPPEDRPEDNFQFVPVGAHNHVHTSVHAAEPQGLMPLYSHWICSSFTNNRCSLFCPSPLPIFLSLGPLSPFEPLSRSKSRGELHHQATQMLPIKLELFTHTKATQMLPMELDLCTRTIGNHPGDIFQKTLLQRILS